MNDVHPKYYSCEVKITREEIMAMKPEQVSAWVTKKYIDIIEGLMEFLTSIEKSV